MNDLELRDERPRGGHTNRLATIASVTSVLTVILLHGLPLLNLFFAVPLFFTLIAFGPRYFAVSAIASFALDALASVALSFVFSPADAPHQASLLAMQSAFLILPVLALAWRARKRYCISAAGALSALAWLAVVLLTDVGTQFTAALRDASGASAEIMYSMMPEGYDKVAFQAMINADTLSGIMTKVFSCAFVSFFVAFYAFSWTIASRVAALVGHRPALAFDARFFFADRWAFMPLAAGMVGIIAGRLASSTALDPLFWNLFAFAALFFALQGYGIARFFLGMFRAKVSRFVSFIVSFGLFLLALELWPVFISVLFVAGVLELFVPVRARFNNNDIADPTPGDGR